jgi:hypothetical protein
MEPEDGRGPLRVVVIDIKARLPIGWPPEREAELIDGAAAGLRRRCPPYDQRRRKAIIREHVGR